MTATERDAFARWAAAKKQADRLTRKLFDVLVAEAPAIDAHRPFQAPLVMVALGQVVGTLTARAARDAKMRDDLHEFFQEAAGKAFADAVRAPIARKP